MVGDNGPTDGPLPKMHAYKQKQHSVDVAITPRYAHLPGDRIGVTCARR